MTKIRSKITDRPVCGEKILSRHLENRGVRERKKIRPKADLIDIQIIQPEGKKEYVAGSILEFNFQTGSFACRLLRNGFLVQLTPYVRNSDYTGLDGATEAAKRKWNGMTPFDPKAGGMANQKYGNRAGIFNPLSGASCLISEVEVYIDNQLVQAVRDGFLSITNTLNKLFLPADVRQQILGHPYILHNENNGIGSSLKSKFNADLQRNALLDPSYHYALDQVNSQNAKDDEKKILISSDLDGVLFCGKPKNLTLEQIYGCASAGENQNALIPPFTQVTFRMRLADPLHLRVIDTGIPDNEFFSTLATNEPGENREFPHDDFHFVIHNVGLVMEKIKWAGDKLHKQLSTGAISYTWDQYIYRATALNENVVVTTTKDMLPPYTQLVYLIFCGSNQLYKDGRKKRSSDGTRFAIPERLTEITIRLDNNVILFEEGLKITRIGCNHEMDATLFYHYLVNRGLTTDSFDSFFPKGGKIGYKNAIPLDLTPLCLSEPSQLSIECKWSGTGCPPNLYLTLFIPQSVNVTRDSAHSAIWKSTAQMS